MKPIDDAVAGDPITSPKGDIISRALPEWFREALANSNNFRSFVDDPEQVYKVKAVIALADTGRVYFRGPVIVADFLGFEYQPTMDDRDIFDRLRDDFAPPEEREATITDEPEVGLTFTYRGHQGTAEFKDGRWVGSVTKTGTYFSGVTTEEAREDFKASVDEDIMMGTLDAKGIVES